MTMVHGMPPVISPTVAIRYSCDECGLKRVSVDVPARTGEDVKMWFEAILTPALVADHQKRSPHCHPKELSEVLIPMTGTDRVGGAPVQ